MFDWVIYRPPKTLKFFKVKLRWSKSSLLLQRLAFLVLLSFWNLWIMNFMIIYKKTDEWYIEWQREVQRVTTSDNEWQRVVQRVTTSSTTSDNEWRVVQRITTRDKEWQRVVQQVTMNDNEWPFRPIFLFFK